MWMRGEFLLHNKFGWASRQNNTFSENPGLTSFLNKESKAQKLQKGWSSYYCHHQRNFHLFFKITIGTMRMIKRLTLENISVQPGWLGSSPPGRRTRKLRISDSEITPVTFVGGLKETNDARYTMSEWGCRKNWENGGSKLAIARLRTWVHSGLP